MKKGAMILAAALILAGCSEGKAEPEKKVQKENNTVILRADDLFKGDAEALEPHLPIKGSAVSLNKPSDVKVFFQQWKNGKMVQEGSQLQGDSQKEIQTITFSLQPDPSNTKARLVTIAANGKGRESSITSHIDGPEKESVSWEANLAELEGRMELKPGEQKAVWGYGTNAGNSAQASDSEKGIQDADWGLLFYVEASQ